MARAEYRCTALVGSTKTGKLTPDANGYYTVVLGALDFFNSAGAFYDYNSAKSLFESSSSLMRRVNSGALRGEYGHPKFTPGMTNHQFLMRIMDINEQSASHHIKAVWIDETSVKDSNGKTVVAIMGSVKPLAGQFGDMLLASLQNPDENVCFSIRSLTEDIVNSQGVTIKTLREIITWDYVNEPGISVANKFSFPSLESMALHGLQKPELHVHGFDIGALETTRDYVRKMTNGMESSITRNIESAITAFRASTKNTASGLILPRGARW